MLLQEKTNVNVVALKIVAISFKLPETNYH